MSDQGDLRLGGYTAAVDARLARWRDEAFGKRMWEKDFRLWSPEPIAELSNRQFWLDLPNSMTAASDRLTRLGRDAQLEGMRDAVVLGMVGRNRPSEVLCRAF